MPQIVKYFTKLSLMPSIPQITVNLRHFSKTLLKEAKKHMDYFILKLITNYNQTGDPKSLCYKVF